MASISITAPSSAEEGERVSVSVRVTNNTAYNYSYKATIYAVPDRYPDYVIGSIDQVILSGASVTRSASFTMPDCKTTVFVWVERWSFDHWVYDGSASKVVSLEIPPVPEVPCKITITAPSSAEEGEKVSVSALLKNVSSYGAMYKTEISAVPDLFPAFRIGTIEKYIDSGASFTAYGSFTMPASNTTILIWVERWAVDHWVYDNSASKVVSLEVVPEYMGSIARKELEYDETRGNIPVY